MSYTWNVLPAIGTSETMETDIRNTLEQWRANFADIDDNVTTFLNGSGAPSDEADGDDGDFYIDTTAWDIYGPKTSGAWGTGTSMIGADGSPGVDGEMSGPASSTDNAIARFDGIDGTTVQDSLVTVDDSGTMNIPDGQTYNINGSPHTHSYLTDIVNDTSPQLGGNLDINEKSIEREFGTLTSDHTASGDIITATAGESVVFGDVCYFKSDGKFWKTDADAEATSKGLIAMAIASISADASGLFLKTGFARDDTWNWTVGAQLFLDTATAGGMTATAPSGSADIVRLVAYVKAADYVEFNPSPVYLEIT